MADLTARRWDAEYRRGRYEGEPPVAFVATVLERLAASATARAGTGLYVGCGNGRNFLPLADAGLALLGLDLSPEALRRLAARRPDLRPRLVCGDLRELRVRRPFAYLVALQVFQHGDREAAVAYFGRAAELVAPGGLLFVRVNAAATEVYHAHTVVEGGGEGGFTVRYDAGPKRGLRVHFYGADELRALAAPAFVPVDAPRAQVNARAAPATGVWVQWEAVWRRA